MESFPKHKLEFVMFIFPAVKTARRIVEQAGGNPNDPKQVTPVATDQNVILVVVIALLICSPRLAQSASTTDTNEDTVVAFAKKVVVQALDYEQGDRESLMDAKDDFTEGGWNEFMKRMDGLIIKELL